MPRKKPLRGANDETFFSQLQKEKPDARARYEAEKTAALVSNFPLKTDEVEIP